MRLKAGIKGIDKLSDALLAQASMSAQEEIVRYHTAELTRLAQAKAPVDTRALKRSIVPDIDTTAKGAVGHVKAYMEYAPYQEYGTRFMEANPYLRPAFDIVKPRFLADIKRGGKL